jgi:hypothetical protein
MLDRMNPGTTPQKAMIGDLGAVVDIDTWETAGDINRSYGREGLLTMLQRLPNVGADRIFLSQRKPSISWLPVLRDLLSLSHSF